MDHQRASILYETLPMGKLDIDAEDEENLLDVSFQLWACPFQYCAHLFLSALLGFRRFQQYFKIRLQLQLSRTKIKQEEDVILPSKRVEDVEARRAALADAEATLTRLKSRGEVRNARFREQLKHFEKTPKRLDLNRSDLL